MKFPFTTQPATFRARPNRFRIEARLHGNDEPISAHCPDPGRLRELLIPGVTVHVSPATNPARKTAWDLRFVEHPENGQLISLDSRLPNQLFAEGLATGFFGPFRGATKIEREVSISGPIPDGVRSRIDYRITDGAGRVCWVEIKSATLVVDRRTLFPDAPTTRGRRHVNELETLVANGERAAVVFIVQRPDADSLSPNWETDPDFAQALVDAQAAGVEIYAYTCGLTTAKVWLDRQIDVDLMVHKSNGINE